MNFKLLTLISVALLMACTSNDDEMSSVNQESNSSTFPKRSYNDAIAAANEAISILDEDNYSSRGIHTSKRAIDLDNIKFITNKKTRSVGTTDTLMYVFNYENNQGYALVSANELTEAIIAVTETGYYDPEKGTNNPGLSQFIQMAESYIQFTKNDKTPMPSSRLGVKKQIKREHRIESETIIGPKLTVRWGQHNPEGLFCPNGVSGCSNTASAMILSYFKYPNSITLSFPDAPQSTLTLNWDELLTHKQSFPNYNQTDNCSNTIHTNLALLCREIGYRSGSSYNLGSTGTNDLLARQTLQNLGLTVSNKYNYTTNCFATALQNNNIVYLLGDAINNNETRGHGWVVDGHKHYVIHTYEYTKSEDDEMWFLAFDCGTHTEDYNHFNWGWDGNDNGYFTDGVFNNQQTKMLDDGSVHSDSTINYSFSNLGYYIINHE